MNDPVLDRRLENCKKLMLLWRRFHDYLNDCIKGKEFGQQEEAEFLKLKSQIAVLHDSFVEAVEGNKSTAQSVISIVEHCILLRQMSKLSAAEIKKMEIEWHESYLLMNDTIGIVQEKIDKIAKISRASFVTRRFIETVTARITRLLTNTGFQVGVAVAALLFAAIVLPMMGVFSYDILLKYPATAKPYIAARTFVRNTLLKDLVFIDYDDYKKHMRQDLPSGYTVADFPANQKDQWKTFFLTKNYSGIEPLDLSADAKNAVDVQLEKTTNEFYMCFVVFKKTTEAKTQVNKIEAWRAKVPVNSEADTTEQQIRTGRIANVVYMVYTPHKRSFDTLIETFGPKK